MSFNDSIFCSSNFRHIMFFDSDGNFIEEKIINKTVKEDHLKDDDCGFVCSYKDNLYMTDDNKSYILEFNMNN